MTLLTASCCSTALALDRTRINRIVAHGFDGADDGEPSS
jgi:hypothetical protein